MEWECHKDSLCLVRIIEVYLASTEKTPVQIWYRALRKEITMFIYPMKLWSLIVILTIITIIIFINDDWGW